MWLEEWESIMLDMEQNAMSGRMTVKFVHCHLWLKVVPIWNTLTIIQCGSFKTNQLKAGWLKSYKLKIFWIAIPWYIQILPVLFDMLHRLEVGHDESSWPLTPHWALYSNFDDNWTKIRRSYGHCIGIILKQIVCIICLSFTLLLLKLKNKTMLKMTSSPVLKLQQEKVRISANN